MNKFVSQCLCRHATGKMRDDPSVTPKQRDDIMITFNEKWHQHLAHHPDLHIHPKTYHHIVLCYIDRQLPRNYRLEDDRNHPPPRPKKNHHQTIFMWTTHLRPHSKVGLLKRKLWDEIHVLFSFNQSINQSSLLAHKWDSLSYYFKYFSS